MEAEKPLSLSAFLGTLAVDNKSHIQTIQHLRKKNQLAHSSTTLNYNGPHFHWGGEMYRKEHLPDSVGDNEVNIKRTSWTNSLHFILELLASVRSFSALDLDFVTQSSWSRSQRMAVHWDWQSIWQYALHLRWQRKPSRKWRLLWKEELISPCDEVSKSVYSVRTVRGSELDRKADFVTLFWEA